MDALASALVAARDWEGMEIALRQHRAAGGEPGARVFLLEGFARAMRGDGGGAAASFRSAALVSRDGVAHFDLALVLLRKGAPRAALTELDAAAAEVQERSTPPSADFFSRIETLRGAARLLDGDFPGARSALSRALERDPHNLRAGLLLQKLEAEGR
jgi:Flp pilus assembly protein TadD